MQPPEPVAPATPSGSSIVGTWNVVLNLPRQTVEFPITFNRDGTFNRPTYEYKTSANSEIAVPGEYGETWTQNGDIVRFETYSDVYEGTINVDTMSGTTSGIKSGLQGHWSASRV